MKVMTVTMVTTVTTVIVIETTVHHLPIVVVTLVVGNHL